MDTTLGELVLRRKLEYTKNQITGIVYTPGQHEARIIKDDAIVSFVDSGGWAIQAFLQRDGDDWGLKTDIIIAVNPYGIECRRVTRSFPLTPSIRRALDEANHKKKAPRQQRQREAPSTTG